MAMSLRLRDVPDRFRRGVPAPCLTGAGRLTILESSVDLRQVSRARNGSREFVTRQIADETSIVPVVGGVGDLDAIFTLNEVGSYIWRLTEQPTTVGAIVDAIGRAFDVPPDRAERDVVEFLVTLAEAGLLQPLSGADPR